jgi:hypothetical protein
MPLLKGSHFLSFAVGRRLENPTLNATMSGIEDTFAAGRTGVLRVLKGC